MIRILHSADWHLGNYPGPEDNGVNLRAKDNERCLAYLAQVARQEFPDVILVSGDIFNQARVWADRGLNEVKTAITIIEDLYEIAPVVILRGTPNHDGVEQFELLKTHFAYNAAVNIVTEPAVKTIYSRNGEPINIVCLPGFDRGVYRAKYPGLSREEENQVFTDEIGRIILGLKASTDSNSNILMSHYTVPGCNTESGQTQFLAQFEPVIMPDVLDAAEFDLVALGHIHKPQQLESCKNTFYSGAINALNFNDEGQERGFWIHELETMLPYDRLIKSTYIKTPSREFKTIRLNNDDVYLLNNGAMDKVSLDRWQGQVDGKIVRVLYSCTDEESKALNKAQLEKEIYADGAFWVSEISPEQIIITAGKKELSDKSDPESNLVEYLIEKAYSDDKIAEIAEAARPIIAQAAADGASARITGIFEPLEIEVSNYRNYVQEKFSFRDITFCTINGRNGAGKSSLFMDAILDCLFEEPREGDLTGWIRNSEEARSGAITFIFRIGERIFRISRTRAKSGKATLNLSELTGEEWVNRSREKYKDTQAEIINLLGMDSLTFRSCALIMQDQYGLFLQADKEDRMTILGNILGLGIYEDMEGAARTAATDLNREISQKKTEIDKLSSDISAEPEIRTKLTELGTLRQQAEKDAEVITTEKDNTNYRLSTALEASKRAEKLDQRILQFNHRETELQTALNTQQTIIKSAETILALESDINAGVQRYDKLLIKEKQLLAGKATYDAKRTERDKSLREKSDLQRDLNTLQSERTQLSGKLKPYTDAVSQENALKAQYDRYVAEKQTLADLEHKASEYIRISGIISEDERKYSTLKTEYEKEAGERTTNLRHLEETAKLLTDSGCIDSQRANCKFLHQALEAKAEIEPYRDKCTTWKMGMLDKLTVLKGEIDRVTKLREELNYSDEAIRLKRREVSALETDVKSYEALPGYKDQIKLITERIAAINTSITDKEAKLSELESLLTKYADELLALEDSDRAYTEVVTSIATEKAWVTKEKELPVAREKKNAAELRCSELQAEIANIESDILNQQTELEKELEASSGIQDLNTQIDDINRRLNQKQLLINSTIRDAGGLQQRLNDIEAKKSEINVLQLDLNELASKVIIFEELKRAFSQDGIPHNIIRSIIPRLTATANNILGQMTSGKMGMEFVTEKILKSNKAKEVVTLDILIEENGNGTLPYMSKSGGEKVKASLSAILALAEIKSSQAGIQLGMLFIDEPPFLDSDGTAAYCDALETIQQRYSSLKIMAITHDPNMKARFPQSLDVVKDGSGSKVIFE